MSATLNLELEQGIEVECIQAAFTNSPECNLDDSGRVLKVYLPSSNVLVTLVQEVADDSVFTEAIENADWRVGARAYLEVDPSRENALEDVRAFVYRLAELTPLRFVLSFGYETLYASRDTEGLFLSEDFR